MYVLLIDNGFSRKITNDQQIDKIEGIDVIQELVLNKSANVRDGCILISRNFLRNALKGM